MREPQWELVEQLIPALQFLDKAMERMCGGRHVGLAFIYPVIMNMINTTLSVEAFVPAPVHTFKTKTWERLTAKLESNCMMKSVPTEACVTGALFQQLQFIPESKTQQWVSICQAQAIALVFLPGLKKTTWDRAGIWRGLCLQNEEFTPVIFLMTQRIWMMSSPTRSRFYHSVDLKLILDQLFYHSLR